MDLIANFMGPTSASTKEVENSIGTLSDRLAHSTLLADRRAAVLGLKSYSRQYRESVIASGLKALLSTLKEDLLDTEIVKAILETLLILFIRGEDDEDLTRNWISQQSRTQNGKYPSPSLLLDQVAVDQFSMWIADALTQAPENVFLLIQILESENFYLRLYALQLLEALCSVRPVRTKECVLKFPVGVSTIIGVLDDVNEPIRNESILLLMGLVNDNYNIQKLVAFENTFDKLYEIIDSEGGVEGSIVVQDCLSLVMNLLKFNASNQKMFLETNCIPKLLQLLEQPLTVTEFGPLVWNDQRISNVTTCLETCRLLLIQGSDTVHMNQQIMVSSNILMVVLKLVFSVETPNAVRSTALLTTSDIIKGNPDIQLQFSQIDVPYLDPVLPTQAQSYDDLIPVNVALFNWCLFSNSVHVFDIRVASSIVLQAYFAGNNEAKEAFVEDQWISFQKLMGIDIGEESEEEPEKPGKPKADSSTREPTPSSSASKAFDSNTPQGNLFYTLTKIEHDSQLNPYKYWFAAVMLLYLFDDCPEAQRIAMGVRIGGESEEEDVLTFIQASAYALCHSLSYSDPRISIAYLMLLIVWLYEDFEAVDQFLADESIVDQLLAYLAQTSNENVLVQGMVTVLLGIAYEFSRSTSPIPRLQLHSIMVSRLGKTSYVLKVLQFQKQPSFQEFDAEAIFDPDRDETGLPKVLFDSLFVNLVKDNFSRIRGAINHDPKVEPVQKISFEAYEKVEDQLAEISSAFELFKTEKVEELENADSTIHALKEELSTLKQAHAQNESELISLRETHREVSDQLKEATEAIAAVEKYNEDLNLKCTSLQKQLEESTSKNAKLEQESKKTVDRLAEVEKLKKTAEDGINKMSRELFQLTREKEGHEKSIKNLEKDLAKNQKNQEKMESSLKAVIKQKDDKISTLEKQISSLSGALKSVEQKFSKIEDDHSECAVKVARSEETNAQLMDKLRAAAEFIERLKAADDESKKHIVELESSSSALVKELEDQLTELRQQRDSFKEKHTAVQADLQSLQTKLSESASQHSALVDSLSQKSEEFDTLKAEIERLKSENSEKDTLAKEIESLKAHRAEADNKSESLAKELSQLKSTHEDLRKMKEAVLLEKESVTVNLSSLKEKYDSLVTEKNELETELEEAKSSHKNAQKENSGKIREITEKHEQLKKHTQSMEDKLKDTHATHTSKIEELDATIADLKHHIEAKDSELAKLKTANDEISAKLISLEAEKKKLTSELSVVKSVAEKKEASLKAEIAKFRERSNSLAEEKASLNSTIEMISQNIQAKEEESTKFAQEASQLKHELTELEKKLKSSEERYASELADLKEQLTTAESIGKENESLQEDIKKLANSRTALESELADEREKLGEKITKLTSEVAILKKEMTEKAKEMDDERKLLAGSSESAVKEYAEKFAALEEKLSSSEKVHASKIVELEDHNERLKSHEKQLLLEVGQLKTGLEETKAKNVSLEKKAALTKNTSDKLLERLKEEVQSLKSERAKLIHDKETLVKELKDEINQHKTQKESAERELDSKLRSLEESSSSKLQECEDAVKAKSEELESLQVQLDALKKQLDGELTNKLAMMKEKASLSDRIDQLEKQLKSGESVLAKEKSQLATRVSELEKLQKSSESASTEKILALEKQLAESTSSLIKERKEFEDAKYKAESKLAALETKHASEREALVKEHESTEARLKEHQSTKEALISEHNSQQTANQKLIEDLTNQVEKLKSKASQMVPKSELDDMMLLMSELDDKSKKYKEIAASLGGDVSSDDDDDEDDDEDEDEDEDDEE